MTSEHATANRVTPEGEVVAVSARARHFHGQTRGGCFHTPEQRTHWQQPLEIADLDHLPAPSSRGATAPVMQPRRYTELFFPRRSNGAGGRPPALLRVPTARMRSPSSRPGTRAVLRSANRPPRPATWTLVLHGERLRRAARQNENPPLPVSAPCPPAPWRLSTESLPHAVLGTAASCAWEPSKAIHARHPAMTENQPRSRS